MKAVLYSTGCPRCKTLKTLLDREGVQYEEVSDIDKMESLGIMTVPVLEFEGKTYSFLEAIQSIGNISKKQKEGESVG